MSYEYGLEVDIIFILHTDLILRNVPFTNKKNTHTEVFFAPTRKSKDTSVKDARA